MENSETYSRAEFEIGDEGRTPRRIEIRLYPAAEKEPEEKIAVPPWLEIRIIALVLIVMGFLAWLSQHTSIPSSVVAFTNGGLAIVTGVLWILGKKIEARLKERTRVVSARVLFALLSTRCLILN